MVCAAGSLLDTRMRASTAADLWPQGCWRGEERQRFYARIIGRRRLQLIQNEEADQLDCGREVDYQNCSFIGQLRIRQLRNAGKAHCSPMDNRAPFLAVPVLSAFDRPLILRSYQGSGFPRWKNPPVGPSSGRVANSALVLPPSLISIVALGPPMSVFTQPGCAELTLIFVSRRS